MIIHELLLKRVSRAASMWTGIEGISFVRLTGFVRESARIIRLDRRESGTVNRQRWTGAPGARCNRGDDLDSGHRPPVRIIGTRRTPIDERNLSLIANPISPNQIPLCRSIGVLYINVVCYAPERRRDRGPGPFAHNGIHRTIVHVNSDESIMQLTNPTRNITGTVRTPFREPRPRARWL